jgi:hypothetical protein
MAQIGPADLAALVIRVLMVEPRLGQTVLRSRPSQ